MRKLVALAVTTTLFIGNTTPIINVYAQSKGQNTVNEMVVKSTIEVRSIEELQAAIDSAIDGTLIKIYPGSYDIATLEINNKAKMILQGVSEGEAPLINGSIKILNQNGITIENLQIKNLSSIHGINITLKKVKASLEIGNTENLSIDECNLGTVYLGGMISFTGAKSTNIINSSISVLKVGYQGKAYDTQISSSTIGQCYIGDTYGLSSNMFIENSKINESLFIGFDGNAENTTIKNCNIKGEVQLATGSKGGKGKAKNTKLIENLYEEGSFNRQGIKVGSETARAEQTTIVNTRDDRLIGGNVTIDNGVNTLLIGDDIIYTTTDNTSNIVTLKEIKEPGNVLRGTGYKGARIEVKSKVNTYLNEVLTKDGEFDLNLNPNVNNDDNIITNIYDTNGDLVNSIEMIVDTRLSIPISTKEDLNKIRENLYGNYHLAQDIVFTASDFEVGGVFYNEGKGWNPIGKEYKNPFKGTLDGKGYEIKGLKVNSDDYAGLFAQNEGTIKNIGISNSNIKANSTTADRVYAGAIAAYNTGIIENCYNTGNVSASASQTMSQEYVGGIVGNNFGGTITNSYNTGNISNESSSYWTYIGGVSGDNRGKISKSFNTGTVNAKNERSANAAYMYIGGVVGGNYSQGTVDQCYNKGKIISEGNGDISLEINAGGIAGSNIQDISNCYNLGSLEISNNASETRTRIGGITGTNRTNIDACYTIGSIKNKDEYISDRISGREELGSSKITSSYYINEKTTIEDFLNKETFKGFDFNKIWTMDGNTDYLYPELRDVNMEFTKEFTGIEISSEPTKKEYIETEALNLSGLVVNAKYNNGGKEEITDYKVSGYTSTPGTKTIIVSYKGKEATFEVVVKENNAPVIDGKDITIKVGDTLTEANLLALVTATDKEDGNITNKIKIKENNLNTTKVGTYTVVYEVVDNHGKSSTKTIKITVRSNEKPVITTNNVTLKVGDKFDNLMQGVTATDKEDGNITHKVSVTGSVNTSKAGVYKLTYKVVDSDNNITTKERTITVNEKLSTINNIPTISAKDITINVGDKLDALKNVSANDKEDGNISSKIKITENTVNTKKPGTYKITYKITDSKGASATKTIKVTVQKVFTEFTVNNINSKDTTIAGKGEKGATVKAYINNKQVGNTVTIDSQGNYKITIPAQKANTNVVVKMSKSGYQTIEKTIKVIGIASKSSKTLTKDIYKYDAGKASHLTFINNKGYSQYVYLNTSGKYAFTPSSWMSAAGLTVSMPTSGNNYTMTVDNNYIGLYNDATKLLDKMKSRSTYSEEEIKTELEKIENRASNITGVIEPSEMSDKVKAAPKKTLTNDIYKYDAGKGKYLTYINGKGYSQFVYLNKTGKYAFTPTSWMSAAGLNVTMPTSKNGYKMQITNPYIKKYEDTIKQIKDRL
ncbi:MAG: immunoglobulin-like domain-containing protein [Peptostreptococcaceae bacterium]